MRWLLRILVGGALVLALAIVLAWIALPRLAESEAVRARIREAARDATGRELGWERLSFGLLPPRLVVRGARLFEAGQEETPVLATESVGLRLALLPLLARTVVVDSLRIDGLSLHVKRTRSGIVLPVEAPAGERPSRETEATEPALSLAVRSAVLRGGRIVLDDRTVTPPVRWELADVEARAEGSSPDEPIAWSLAAVLASGGSVSARGSARLDGSLQGDARLDDFVAAPLLPYLPDGARVDGPLSGRLQAERAGSNGGLRADFSADATRAEFVVGSALRKPAGVTARISGRLVERDAGFAIDALQASLRNFEATGRLDLAERARLVVEAPAFSVEGWEALLPALEELDPGGQIAFEALEVSFSPLEVSGRIPLTALRVRPAGGDPLTLDGSLEARGTTLVGEALRIRVAEQTVDVDLRVAGFGGSVDDLTYRVKVATRDADTNALLSALTTLSETLYGPLSLDADLRGALPRGEGETPIEGLEGSVRLAIGKGRIKGVSLLRGTLERLGTIGTLAMRLGEVEGGRTLQRFYDDEFESISGTFRLADGLARSDDLRLVYRNYSVDLRGTLGLIDRGLDFSGKLTIAEEVDEAVGQAVRGEASDAKQPGKVRVIPLARVVGTLEAPRVDLSREAVTALVGSYALARQRGDWETRIDETLGEGAGKQVLDRLEDLLGRGSGP